MATLEAGLFFIMLALSFIFTFISFRMVDAARTALRLLAMGLFLGLAGFIGSGFEVAATTTYTGGDFDTPLNETRVLIAGGEESYWFAWVFAGLGFMNLIFIVKEVGIGANK